MDWIFKPHETFWSPFTVLSASDLSCYNFTDVLLFLKIKGGEKERTKERKKRMEGENKNKIIKYRDNARAHVCVYVCVCVCVCA